MPKLVVPKVRVWPKQPKEHYKFKYSWLPQPLLHKAANMVYKDRGMPKAEAETTTTTTKKKKRSNGPPTPIKSMTDSKPGGMFLTAQGGGGSYDDYDDDDGLELLREDSSHVYPGPPASYSKIDGMHAKAFAH